MAEKIFTEVTLLGKTYRLGGYEDELYLKRVATYVNGKEQELRRMQGYLRQNSEFRNLLMLLNVADDYFKTRSKLDELEKKQEAMEQELYNLKHELANQMRYENR